MRKKAITVDCVNCNDCTIDDDSQMICTWGKGKPKIMFPPKGKKPLQCKLKKD